MGAAIAQRLYEGGALVAVLDLAPDNAPAEYFVVATDVSDDLSVTAAVNAVAKKFGRIDIVINNAGIAAQGTVNSVDTANNSVDTAKWHRVWGRQRDRHGSRDQRDSSTFSESSADESRRPTYGVSAVPGLTALTRKPSRAMAADHFGGAVQGALRDSDQRSSTCVLAIGSRSAPVVARVSASPSCHTMRLSRSSGGAEWWSNVVTGSSPHTGWARRNGSRSRNRSGCMWALLGLG
jgi:NAD(P)-dependent dehydrogenase (short-subunit alcohol dehydrogenase family)